MRKSEHFGNVTLLKNKPHKKKVSSSIGKGARPGADRQTHRHTQNGPKTEDLYIFFILYFYFFIGGLKDTNNLTHAQGVNSQC